MYCKRTQQFDAAVIEDSDTLAMSQEQCNLNSYGNLQATLDSCRAVCIPQAMDREYH